LEALLHKHPDMYQPLLVILSEKVTEGRDDERALLNRM
jgi:hypothetical protein